MVWRGVAWLTLWDSHEGSETVRGPQPPLTVSSISTRPSLISLQLAFSPVRIFAIGIELPLMMAMDRLQHCHLRKDHRAAVLGRARRQMSGPPKQAHTKIDDGLGGLAGKR